MPENRFHLEHLKGITQKLSEVQLVQHIKDKFAHLIQTPSGVDYINSQKKRIADIAISIFFLPIAIPLGLASALIIKLEDGGPIFYIAHVPGKNGEEFGLIKFRTMKLNSQDQNPLYPKKKDDQRVTRFGKFARRMSIDEVPQLVYLLKGDITLVGRRPMFQSKIDELAKSTELSDLYMPWLQATTSTKPGLFDLATGRGRALLDQDMSGLRRRLRYETFSVKHASIGFDMKIAYEAIKAGITGKGAF